VAFARRIYQQQLDCLLEGKMKPLWVRAALSVMWLPLLLFKAIYNFEEWFRQRRATDAVAPLRVKPPASARASAARLGMTGSRVADTRLG
jgi:hypothetical protein